MTTPEKAKTTDIPGYSKYNRQTNKGNVRCDYCGRLTWAGRARNQAGFCAECYDLMGYVNKYSDEGNKVKEAEYQAKLNARRKKDD